MTAFATREVASPDGARLGVHSLGSGPGLVIVHGAMQSGVSQLELARLLSPAHTVHLVDRRGRAGSDGPPATNTATEVADLRAVLEATGAHDVLGVSSGAIIAARAALAGAPIRRLALFEPPLAIGGSVRLDLMPRFLSALDAGDLPRAMAVAMKVAEMGPPWMFGLPIPVLATVSRRMLAADDARTLAPGAAHVRDLALAVRADFAIVTENADSIDDFATITTPTLLINGTRTRPYLRKAVAALAATIPGARRVELDGQSHGVTQDKAQWGRPEVVAPVLESFF